MCPHILKKRSKPLVESFGTKQYHRGSYNIFKRPPEENVVNEPRER
jgi:hypothetical protein